MPIALLVVAAGAAIYSGVESHKAAKKAGQVDTATANYNAKLDEAQSAQLDLDTQQNIRTERQDDSIYLSRQASSYAAAGVLANTGSALDAQILNAGRFEQKIQQQWVDLNQKQAQIGSAAKVGRLEGAARREADQATGKIALINMVSKVASIASSAYSSGAFSGGGSGGGGGGGGGGE